jgi:hypothetical protein
MERLKAEQTGRLTERQAGRQKRRKEAERKEGGRQTDR